MSSKVSMMKKNRIGKVVASLAVVGIAATLPLLAQQYDTYRGSNAREGRHDGDQAIYDPGRSFLRWWDPPLGEQRVVDNDDPGAIRIPVGDWFAPTGQEASNAVNALAERPYYFAFTTASRSVERYWERDPSDPNPLRTFTFEFPGVNAGEDYVLFVNIPVGPTDIDPGPGTDLRFPQRFYVYEITGVVNPDDPGQPIYQRVDTFAAGGTWVRLGNDGLATDRVFRAVGGGLPIRIRLLNTVPRDPEGRLYDQPGATLVYGDAAMIMRSTTAPGTYAASPVVAFMNDVPGTPSQSPWRVITARNESFDVQFGSRVLNTTLGVVNSFDWEGTNFNPGEDGTGRRNLVWSWPARRPFAATTEENRRYDLERAAFVTGAASTYPGHVPFPRAKVAIDKDNLSSGVVPGTGWVPSTLIPGYRGENYYTQPAIVGGPTSRVVYEPALKPGKYEIYIWRPGGTGLPSSLEVEIYEGGAIGGVFSRTDVVVDQNGSAGWVRLRTAARSVFEHRDTARLAVAITNSVTNAADTGRPVFADAIRFVRQADLAVTSTPVATRAFVNVPGQGVVERKVVLVAMENGRIYCLDAKGDVDASNRPTGSTRVYWVYPSERENDPNHVPSEDGRHGIAEMPVGFDLSSALVQRLEVAPGVFRDFLYVASRNGRVYCIEMEGRGDGTATEYGTTRRVWSYPDDYDPTDPTAPIARSLLGPFVGSLAFGEPVPGQPTLYVPTTQGRLYALDARGNPATKSTTVRWAYPALTDPVLRPIGTTPAYAFGNVYFGTGINGATGEFYAVNAATGSLVWSRSQGTALFGPFGTSSAAPVPAGLLNVKPGPPMPDTVFVGNSNGYIYALHAQTGQVLWETNELQSAPGGSVTFQYQTVYNLSGVLEPDTPVVTVPVQDGRFTSLFARADTVNRRGTRRAWEYVTEAELVTTDIATGGGLTGSFSWMYGLDDLGYLYAFHDDPSRISRGVLPGSRGGSRQSGDTIVENDPRFDSIGGALDTAIGNAKVVFLAPQNYEQIVRGVRERTLTYPQLQALITSGATTRRHFELGETLYMVVYDLPQPEAFDPPLNYFVEVILAVGGLTQRRELGVLDYDLPGAPSPLVSRVTFTQLPLIPTGQRGPVPGPGAVTTRLVVPSPARLARDLPLPYSPWGFRLAHPMGIIVNPGSPLQESLGNTTDPTNSEVQNNGNLLENGLIRELLGRFGPELSAPDDEVSHGQTGLNLVYVIDRSLMRLVLGPDRGLSNVRFAVNDLAWQGGVQAVVNPLDPSLYPGYEDLPIFQPNISVDYPDVRRENLAISKDILGSTENPLFTAVTLAPPAITQAALDAYRTPAGYNDGLPNRQLRSTLFFVRVDVPRYQPPSRPVDPDQPGYRGRNVVYVDQGRPGREFTPNLPSETFREFDLGLRVAIDQRLEVGSPTVDLGSLPSGGGFLGDSGGPLLPWVLGDQRLNFSPWNPNFEAFFRPVTVFNEGNVNLLNVRLAKMVQPLGAGQQAGPIGLDAPSNEPGAWLDARYALYSDLDPRFAPDALGNRVILQKARAGDGLGNRLSVNPVRRNNPNLGVVTSPHPLLDPLEYPPGDPKVGVAAPVGTPVGSYLRRLFVFEDLTGDGPHPILGPDPFNPVQFEPFTDPGFVLRFSVRETRLTNRPSAKAAPMIDAIGPVGEGPFVWSNRQPAAMRDAEGDMIVAFASNRLDAGSVPGFVPRLRTPDDTDLLDSWRLYFGRVRGSRPDNAPLPSPSPILDLNGFVPHSAQRWFEHSVGPYPNLGVTPPESLFGLQAGETIQPGSVQFGGPAFPVAGFFNPLDPITLDGRGATQSRWFAFIGSATKVTPRGDRIPVSRVFVANLRSQNGLTIGNPIPLELDDQGQKGKPSVIQQGEFVGVFYTSNAAGLPQLLYSRFNGATQSWLGGPVALAITGAFESIDTASATLRRYRGGASGRGPNFADLLLTGKLRGRGTAEVFYGRVALSDTLGVVNARQPFSSFPTRRDALVQDPGTGTYWAPGVDWRIAGSDVDPGNTAGRVDILQVIDANTRQSILRYETLNVDQATRIVSADTVFGGRVFIDAPSGAIRFSGAILPKDVKLVAQYTPRLLRINEGPAANYRGSSLAFDERFIADRTYWLTASPNNLLDAPIAADALLRNDRFVMVFGRTSTDGTQATRPAMRSFRFGVQLPTAVLTTIDGNFTRMKVALVGGPGAQVPAVVYQVDPARGRIYFPAEFEDRQVRVRYDGVDEAGLPLPDREVTLTVGPIPEAPEVAVPIEQVGNESVPALALDPMSSFWNRQQFRRPGLTWLVWTSTRTGAPEVFLQSIAPRWSPVRPGP